MQNILTNSCGHDNCPKDDTSNKILSCKIKTETNKQINNQTRIPSSLNLYNKKANTMNCYTKSLCDTNHANVTSIQTSCKNCDKNELSKVTYNLSIIKTRTANKNNTSVEKKHNSYNRYLTKRVGLVLEKENKILKEKC